MVSQILTVVVFCAQIALALTDNVPTVLIAPGVEMPVVGLGSCCGTYNVTAYIQEGHRAIDTSCDYGSQPNIGLAIHESGIPRDQFWITSKINVESCSDDVTAAVQTLVLDPLNVTYVDLLLLHHAGRWETDNDPRPACWNVTDAGGRGSYYQCRIETLQSMAKLAGPSGMFRSFGVSNWEIRDLEQLKNATGLVPAVNQIENHPYWHTDDILQYCQANNITVTAYAPFANAHFNMIQDPAFPPIAAAHNTTIGRVILRWSLQIGASIVIPRSMTPEHMAENVDIFDFELTDAEMTTLNSFPQQKVYHTNCQPWC